MDKISKVESQLDELKDIMVKNIGKIIFSGKNYVNYGKGGLRTFFCVLDNIASRGERLELLVNKAENLNTAVSSVSVPSMVYTC